MPRLMVARSGEGVHPVVGLWPVTLAPALEASLKQGERTVSKWIAAHGAVEVLFPDVEIGGRRIDPFFNINRPGTSPPPKVGCRRTRSNPAGKRETRIPFLRRCSGAICPLTRLRYSALIPPQPALVA